MPSRKKPYSKYSHNAAFDDLGFDPINDFNFPPPQPDPVDYDQTKHAYIIKCQQRPVDEDNDFFFSDSVRHTVKYKSPNGLIVYTASSKQPFGPPIETSHDPKADFEDNLVFEVVTEYNTVTNYNKSRDPFAGLGQFAPFPPPPRSRSPSRSPSRSRSRSRTTASGEEILGTLSDVSPSEPPTLQITSLKGKTCIKIHSSAVILALKNVVEFYPGKEDLNETKTVTIEEPYTMIIHHWDQLHTYRNQRGPHFAAEDYCIREQSAFHDLGLLLDFVGSTFMQQVEAEKARHANGKATWEMLWLLYKPGMDAVLKVSGSSRVRACASGGHVVKSVKGGPYESDRSAYSITLQTLEFDGDYLRWADNIRSVSYFEGEIDIADLEVVPVDMPIATNRGVPTYRQLVEKGKHFHSMTSVCCKQHSGKRLKSPYTDLDGLVMVDMKAYLHQTRQPPRMPNPSASVKTTIVTKCSCQVCLTKGSREPSQRKFSGYDCIDPKKQGSLTDHQYFLCPAVIGGFHFKTREWHMLDVDNLSAPQFKTDMIDTLVMPPGQIKMLKALSKNFMRHDTDGNARRMWSADFVEGKGSSQIFLLHGRPGVGKTYTAECLAEHTRRPLMTLTCTDIGTDAEEVEKNLEKHFTTAKNWGAILLIDEADVYMEKRATTDLIRNSLVASFLRALETYEGILFLTTNRVGAFDDAFVSRIHVKLYYPPLRDIDRKKIWRSFMDKLTQERKDMRVTRDAKDAIEGKKIRTLELNGREIRNAFQTAVALAEYEAEKDDEGRIVVDERHILQVAEMSRDFKCYLDDLHQGDEGRRAVRERERLDDFVADEV